MPQSPQTFEFRPRPPLVPLLGIPLGAVVGSVAFILADFSRGAARVVAVVVAGLCAVIMLLGVYALWRHFARATVRLSVDADALHVDQPGREPYALRWQDVNRVRQSGNALIFDVGAPGSGHVVVSAPASAFPSDALVRTVGAALDASRGYQSTLCTVSGEDAHDAIEHGACSNPLGCGAAGGCAAHALRGGVGEQGV